MIIVTEKVKTQEVLNTAQLNSDVKKLFQKWKPELTDYAGNDDKKYMSTILLTTIKFIEAIEHTVYESRQVPKEIYNSYADGHLFALEKVLETAIGKARQLLK
jgi:hypothetical protein